MNHPKCVSQRRPHRISKTCCSDDAGGNITADLVRALAYGRVSENDASLFVSSWRGDDIGYIAKFAMKLDDLELSVRAINCLETEGIATVGDLVLRSEEELLEVRNFNEKALAEVKAKLAEIGLHLGMTLRPSRRTPR